MWVGPMTAEMEDIYLCDDMKDDWQFPAEEGAGDWHARLHTDDYQEEFLKETTTEEYQDQWHGPYHALQHFPAEQFSEKQKPFDLKEHALKRDMGKKKRVRRSLFKLSEIKPKDPPEQDQRAQLKPTTKYYMPSSGNKKRVRFFRRAPNQRDRQYDNAGLTIRNEVQVVSQTKVKQFHMPKSNGDVLFPQESYLPATPACFDTKHVPRKGSKNKNIVPLTLGSLTTYYLPGKSVPEPHFIQIYKNPEGVDCLLVPVPSGGQDNFVLQPISKIPFMHSGIDAENPEDEEYVLTWIPFRD